MTSQPNEALKRLLHEAGWSYSTLARRVNGLGTRHGTPLIYDKSSVSHWISGKKPRPAVARIICEALSVELNRSISLEDAGLGTGYDSDLVVRSAVFQDSLSEELDIGAKLGNADMDRRHFLYLIPYSGALAVGAQRDWLLHLLATSHRYPPSQISGHEIDGMAEMATFFSIIDDRFGGEHARSAMTSYLVNDVLPLLRKAASGPLKRELFHSAGLLYLTLAWMTYDAGFVGLAQRYLARALYLAQQAETSGLVLGSHILSASSHIATFSRNPKEGAAIAQAAIHTARQANSRTALVRAHLMEARAHATLNDGKDCASAITAAEKAFDITSGRTDEPESNQPFGVNTYVTNQVAFCATTLGQWSWAADLAEEGIQEDAREGRQATLNKLYLASARLGMDELESSVQLAAEAMAGGVQSALVRSVAEDFILRAQRMADRTTPDIAAMIAAMKIKKL